MPSLTDPFRPRRRSTQSTTIVVGLSTLFLAACAGSSANWSSQKQTVHALDSVAQLSIPATLRDLPDRTERTADWVSYHFRKPYKSHLNGMSSYSEALSVVLFAPDLPRERMDSLLANGMPRLWELGWGRHPGLGVPGDASLRWLVSEQNYDRHPVLEPSWYVRVDDRAKGIVIGWRGFKKDYTLEQAKSNIVALHGALRVEGNLARDFDSRRSWVGDAWKASYAKNMRVLTSVLAEEQLVPASVGTMARKGDWRVFIDDERPQQLYLMQLLAGIALPDGPIDLLAPVTYYKYMQQRWVQENQGGGGGMLPEYGQQALATEFTSTERRYFYRIRTIDLWRAYASEAEFAKLVRATLRELKDESARLRRDGFIGGDAEP